MCVCAMIAASGGVLAAASRTGAAAKLYDLLHSTAEEQGPAAEVHVADLPELVCCWIWDHALRFATC